MKRARSIAALTLLLAAAAVHAQSVDLGPDVSSYTRFLVYPHLQKGFEAIQSGDRARAYQEFGQALKLAPQSSVIVGYLADAYLRFGEPEKARRLLREQLAAHPKDPDLRAALAALTPPAPAPAPRVRRSTAVAAASAAPKPAAEAAASERPAVPSMPEVATKPAEQVAKVQPASKPKVSPPASAAPVVAAPRAPRAAEARAVRSRQRSSVKASSPAPPPPPPPEPSAAYRFADAGFKASARGDFKSAAVAARQALDLEQENDDYRRLLAYALLETGAYDEAETVAGQGAKSDKALAELAGQARQRRAYADFESANHALADGNTTMAVERARRGAELEPSNAAQQVQWMGALAAAHRWTDLDATTTQLLGRPGMDAADLLMLRAHARQRLGRGSEAMADYDRALALGFGNNTLEQNARLIAADAALADGQPGRVQTLLKPLQGQAEPAVEARLRQALAAATRSVTPDPVVTPSLTAPKVVCVGSSYTPHCELWPGEMQADPGAASAEAAVRAYGKQSYAEAVTQARSAVEHAPGNVRYQLLYVRALKAGGKPLQALEAANGFLGQGKQEPEMLALRSELHRQLQQLAQAQADADAALADPRLSVVSEIDLRLPRDPERARAVFENAQQAGLLSQMSDTDAGYLAVRVGDDASAAQAFARASDKNELPPKALLDAGYVAGRLGQSDVSVGYFKRAIDAADDGKLTLTPQRLFETRREVADRSRSWGAIASVGYRGISPGGQGAGAAAGIGDSVQTGLELYWRPSGYRDGTYYELYGGGFQTLWSKGGGASGGETAQGMLGARIKPLRSANLVLSAERRVKIGSLSINDWLLRAGYSYTYGTDLRMDASSWNTAQVYAEAGRFIDTRRTYATFEAQLGRSFKLDSVDPRPVVFPHFVLGADHDSKLASGRRTASGAGVGVAVRYWFNEDRYRAPHSYFDVSLQYRARLGGDERGKGVFLRATLSY